VKLVGGAAGNGKNAKRPTEILHFYIVKQQKSHIMLLIHISGISLVMRYAR
jgi:hypothetical protein